jgi:hypothetical protein
MPAVAGGAVAVMVVADITANVEAAVLPNQTLWTLVKLVPVMVTTVPPPVGPLVALNPVTVAMPVADV